MAVASVGDRATAETEITADSIETFAELSGDTNPLHLDEEYAAETTFGRRIAHGILTAGVISAALATLPGDVIYLEQQLEFEAPVFPGDTVVGTALVTEQLGGDRLCVETTATVPEREKTVLSGEAIVLSVPHNDGCRHLPDRSATGGAIDR